MASVMASGVPGASSGTPVALKGLLPITTATVPAIAMTHPVAIDAPQPQDLGKLLTRLALGFLILLHGIAKVQGGVGPVQGMLERHGLPGMLAYGVYVGEVLAPLLMVGLWTRGAAMLIAVNMLVAVALAHAAQMFTLGPQGGWALELQGMYLFTALALTLLGAGRLSVGGLNGKWN